MSQLKETRRQLSAFGAELGRIVAEEAGALYASGAMDDEESLTGGLCMLLASRRMQQASDLADSHDLNVAVVHKVREEPFIGADLMITFHSALPAWVLTTRTLVQAKRVEPNRKLRGSEWARMQDQARTMLSQVNESFILGYARDHDAALYAVPALSAAGCASRELFDLDGYRFDAFLEGIFSGLIGQAAVGRPPPGQSWARHEIRIIVEQARRQGEAATAMHSPAAPGGVEGEMAS